MPHQLDPQDPTLTGRRRPTLIVGLAALICLALALLNLYSGLQSGGVPPEFALFGILAMVFGALWWSMRKI